MKINNKILALVVFSLALSGTAKADMAPPSYQTTFYFQQQNGQPINQAVKFTIKCYGTGAFDESNKVLKISEFSGTAQSYGAAFDTSNLFETYRQNTKYCDLSGEVNDKQFQVQRFLGAELTGLSCQNADFDMYNGRYYKDNIDVTDKLIKDANGQAFDKICEVKIKVPFNVSSSSTNTQQQQTIQATTSISSDAVQSMQPTTTTEPVKPKGFFARIFGSINCFFKRLFGKSC